MTIATMAELNLGLIALPEAPAFEQRGRRDLSARRSAGQLT